MLYVLLLSLGKDKYAIVVDIQELFEHITQHVAD